LDLIWPLRIEEVDMSIQDIPSANTSRTAKGYGKRRRKKAGRGKSARSKKPSSFNIVEMWVEIGAMIGLICVIIAGAFYIFRS